MDIWKIVCYRQAGLDKLGKVLCGGEGIDRCDQSRHSHEGCLQHARPENHGDVFIYYYGAEL